MAQTTVTFWDGDNTRRVDFETRRALMWLRLAEDRAAPYLPPYRVRQLADAIDGVVALIRKTEESK